MKTKQLLLGSAAILALIVSACSSELDTQATAGTEADVNFSVSLEQIASRAYSDGTKAQTLAYTVYEAGTTNIITSVTDATIENKSATVDLHLITGRSYDVIFWAASATAPYTYDAENQTVTADYSNVDANDENLDAFYAHTTIEVKGPLSEAIVLKRPFAQINIGTNDYTYAVNAKMVSSVENVKVAVATKSYNTINLFTDKITDDASTAVTFKTAAIPASTVEKFPIDGYNYLAMNYILVPTDKETTDVAISVYDGDNTTAVFEAKYANIPVQRNYRTNIYGSLFTSPASFNLSITPDYETPDLKAPIWDGEELAEPAYDSEKGYAVISTPAQFAYLLNYEGITKPSSTEKVTKYEITENLNMGGYTVPPFDASAKYTFSGFVINGNGHTVSNFITATNADNRTGLFPYAENLTVNDLVIEGAVIGDVPAEGSEQVAGALVGEGTDLAFSNITVQNCSVNGVNKVGGVVGSVNATSDGATMASPLRRSVRKAATLVADGGVTIKGCKVAGTKLNGYGKNAGRVGGVIGYTEAKVTISDCKVESTTISVPDGSSSSDNGNGLIIGTAAAEVTLEQVEADETTCEVESNSTANELVGGTTGEGSVERDNVRMILTVADLDAALNEEGATEVVMTNDLTGTTHTPTSPGSTKYYAALVVPNGMTLDGNGYSFTATGTEETSYTWGCAIYTSGGTIKNLTISKGFREIFSWQLKSTLYIDNCVLNGPSYTFNIDGGGNQDIYVNKTALNGWTSYTNTLKSVTFTDCSFGKSVYAYFRPQCSTTLTNCTFSAGFEVDSRFTNSNGVDFIMKNCYCNGTLITADNITTLLGEDAQYVIVEND